MKTLGDNRGNFFFCYRVFLFCFFWQNIIYNALLSTVIFFCKIIFIRFGSTNHSSNLFKFLYWVGYPPSCYKISIYGPRMKTDPYPWATQMVKHP